jgi:hypothetical protein
VVRMPNNNPCDVNCPADGDLSDSHGFGVALAINLGDGAEISRHTPIRQRSTVPIVDDEFLIRRSIWRTGRFIVDVRDSGYSPSARVDRNTIAVSRKGPRI